MNNLLFKVRTFALNRYSKEYELVDAKYEVISDLTLSEARQYCADNKTQEMSFEVIGEISDRDAQIIQAGKDDVRILEIAQKAKAQNSETVVNNTIISF